MSQQKKRKRRKEENRLISPFCRTERKKIRFRASKQSHLFDTAETKGKSEKTLLFLSRHALLSASSRQFSFAPLLWRLNRGLRGIETTEERRKRARTNRGRLHHQHQSHRRRGRLIAIDRNIFVDLIDLRKACWRTIRGF